MSKKRPQGIKNLIFSRVTLVAVFLLFQIVAIIATTMILEKYSFYIYAFMVIISAVVVINLSNNNSNTDLTFTWMLLILVFPVFGTIFYLFVKTEFGTRKLSAELSKIDYIVSPNLTYDTSIEQLLKKSSLSEYRFSTYMYKYNNFPVYLKDKIKYFPTGEDKFEELKIQLLKAKKFIFMEYFIVAPGKMLDEVIKILEHKASQGVDVRFMYDGMNTISTIPFDFDKYLNSKGIKTKIFAPMKPIVSTTQNSRDHRKITVVDGDVAFTGGINIADEYINEIERFGHWKDSAIMVTGNAVNSFTMLFLKMWNVESIKYDEFEKYIIKYDYNNIQQGFLIPYGDSPYDKEDIGKNVYLHMIEHSNKYLHITTPYLILGNDVIDALILVAKSGVEVKIIMPGVPDKYYAFALAKTYYQKLIEAGVKIYEYTPGFVHAKNFICDGERASVGTVNLDYRSLYHHFECGVYMYRCQEIFQIEKDFDETLTKCRLITINELKNRSVIMKFIGWILKLIAPLM